MSIEQMTAGSRHGTAREIPRAAKGDAALAGLLDALIEQAPTLVRHKHLLPAADWRLASSDQVLRLQERLADAGAAMPRWLGRALLVAGHRLRPETEAGLTAELRLLASLNGLEQGGSLPGAVRHAVLDSTASQSQDADVAKAITNQLNSRGEAALACQYALGVWPHVPDALRVVRSSFADALAAMPALRLHLAGFSTTQLFADALVPAFARVGRRAEVEQADFASVIASLLDPAGPVDAMLILLDQESLLAPDWRSDLNRGQEAFESRLQMLSEAVMSYVGRHDSPLFINTLPATVAPFLGHLDRVHGSGAGARVARVNQTLASLAARSSSIQLIDTDVALADLPPKSRFDPRLWYYGRLAYSEDALARLAGSFAQGWKSRESGPVKVVALDFDSTLWGGVFGDDGIGKLHCGDDFPGNAFKAFQQECLRLKAQGILLVALSKNNPDAIGVFADHPGMVLSADDFVATAIDWQAKPDNIRRLAEELSLGLDSFLFLDDSPHEREAMRRMCPEVLVPEMPDDPEQRPLWLRSLACTWPVRLTEEDAKRTQMYAADRKARRLRSTAGSYDDYLRDLEQSLVIEPLDARNLSRIAQLHARTNQFNLTTRRFAESELSAFMHDENAVALAGSVSDRFGDHGIVVAAVAAITGSTATIESFLMSCRVISRQIETAFLGSLVGHLVERGIETVQGRYLATHKNALVREFYPAHGFAPLAQDGRNSEWVWRKATDATPRSDNVRVQRRQS